MVGSADACSSRPALELAPSGCRLGPPASIARTADAGVAAADGAVDPDGLGLTRLGLGVAGLGVAELGVAVGFGVARLVGAGFAAAALAGTGWIET